MARFFLIFMVLYGGMSCAFADSGNPPIKTVGVDFRANMLVLPDRIDTAGILIESVKADVEQ